MTIYHYHIGHTLQIETFTKTLSARKVQQSRNN